MDKKEFLLDEGLTPDGFDIFTASRAMSPNIAYFLPKNTSVKQVRDIDLLIQLTTLVAIFIRPRRPFGN